MPGRPLALVVAVISVPLVPKMNLELPLPLPSIVSVPMLRVPLRLSNPTVLPDFSLNPELIPDAFKVAPESTYTKSFMAEISPDPVQLPLEVNSRTPPPLDVLALIPPAAD